MHATRLYREQHTRIRALCRPLLDPDRANASPSTLRSALAKLAGLVKLHLRDEDGELYPRLLEHADPHVRDVATAFQATMGGLAERFVRFYETWVGAGAIDADRIGFFADADEVLGALAARMDREDRELYELADRSGDARFLA